MISMTRAKISYRVSPSYYTNSLRRAELLEFLAEYRDTIDEVAFFTAFTHPPRPLAFNQERAALLQELMPRCKALGLSTGINHLATIGHLDENLPNSLNEPWQRLTDIHGNRSAGCYCPADPQMQEYIAQSYIALAAAEPDFIWVDDDVRMESHPPLNLTCFCDRCLARFATETATAWTRETLQAAFNGGTRDQRMHIRKAWLAHNRALISELLTVIRHAVDTVNPQLPLGLMTGEIAYSGYAFAEWAAALAGPEHLPVKWRPGGGFYNDERPLDLLVKTHGVGRQVGLLPESLTEIQYEHENFPYQRLKKSNTIFGTEIAAGIGAGCTGVALNLMGTSPDPFDEYRPYFDRVRAHRAFYDKAVATFGRSHCEGIWPAFSLDNVAAMHADDDWGTVPLWGSDMHVYSELAEIGLPTAYTRAGAAVTVLSGDHVFNYSTETLRELFAGGLLLDVPALLRIHELGLGDFTGFTVSGSQDVDTIESFTTDPLNGRFAGWQRDCRPSFWREKSYFLTPQPGARVIAEVQDFSEVILGATSGVFENALGGRVAVLGYYPWGMLQTLAKVSQMRALCRWLSKDTLPAYVASYDKAALWCRRDAQGHPALLALNASLDAVDTLEVYMRDIAGPLTLTRPDGSTDILPQYGIDGPYAIYHLLNLPAWEAVMVSR